MMKEYCRYVGDNCCYSAVGNLVILCVSCIHGLTAAYRSKDWRRHKERSKDMVCSKTVMEGRTRTGFALKAGTAARTRDLVGKEKVRDGTWWEYERDLVGKGKGPGGKRKEKNWWEKERDLVGKRKGTWWEKERDLVGKGKGPGGKRKGTCILCTKELTDSTFYTMRSR
jgi:hypothetical protein